MSALFRKEKYYANRLGELYHRARNEESFSMEAAQILEEAAVFREDYGSYAVPMVTTIGKDNISRFLPLTTEDLAEEIVVHKSRGIGMLRLGDDGATYAVSAAVWYADRTDAGEILRIKWLYVHPLYRKQGIGNAMLAELMHFAIKGGFYGITVDLYEGAFPILLKELLEKWHYTFSDGIEPDFILRLSDVGEKDAHAGMAEAVMPLSSLDDAAAARMPAGWLETLGYDGFLYHVPEGYIDSDLSCFIGSKDAPDAAALVHVSPQGRILVEHYDTQSQDAAAVLNLVAYIAPKARDRFGEEAVLRMRLDSFEIARLLDRAFPRQQTCALEEGVLLLRRDEENDQIEEPGTVQRTK